MSHFLKGLSADKFNQKYPVGSSFKYFPIMGIPNSVDVVTSSKAWALSHGAVVVRVNGCDGDLPVEQMTPVVKDKHIEESAELRKAAERYTRTFKAHKENAMGADELAAWDEATNEFFELIDNDEINIIASLLAKQEAAEKEIHGLKMKLSDAGCLLVEWKQRVEKADKERDELEMSQNVANDATCIWKGRAKAAETRLLVPVKLPSEFYFHSSAENIPVMRAKHVKEAIRAAGFLVEGGSNDH